MFIRRRHKMPQLNTASLPDLIFTVLFFFMIVTSMRSAAPEVAFTVPSGTEINKPTRKPHIIYIYVGKALTAGGRQDGGGGTLIQVNDRICPIDAVSREVTRLRSAMDDSDAGRLTVVIKADRSTDMGTITDIKMALRRAKAYRVCYAASDRPEQ